MALMLGRPNQFSGTLGASSQLKQLMLDRDGNPRFARSVTVQNTGAGDLKVGYSGGADVQLTVPAGASITREGIIEWVLVMSAAGTTWEIAADIAG